LVTTSTEQKLERELEQLRPRHVELERSVGELLRLGSPQAALVSESLDKAAKKIASLERRLRVLRGEPEPVASKPKLKDNPLLKPKPRSKLVEEQKPAPCLGCSDHEVEEMHQLAAACDEHARALGSAVKQLHQKLTAARMANNGRGPSAVMVNSVFERAFAQYVQGTPLRSLRGPVNQPQTFSTVVSRWAPMLRPPTPLTDMGASL
jgi:hypothetical protein